MNEGLIATCKLYYLQLAMRYRVSESDGESKPIAQEWLKKCNTKIARLDVTSTNKQINK
jgi:hypothetical protein